VTPPTPPPAPDPAEAIIRNVAWNVLYPAGVAYAPDHAFPKQAKTLGLGQPLTVEQRFGMDGKADAAGAFILQGFDGQPGKILWCRYGDWANIHAIAWQ
jgi:hypothetical protein